MEDERYGYEQNSSYEQNSTYTNPYTVQKPVQAPKKKKKGGAFKKAMAAICLGALFGATSAGAFYGVIRYTGTEFITSLGGSSSKSSDGTDKDVKALQNTVASIEKALKNGEISEGTTLNLANLTTPDVTSVVNKVMPSMVAVTNNYEQEVTTFWGRSYTAEGEGSGSGIIVGEDDTAYFIATNYHVIDKAKKLTVQFVDESTAEAYVKGYNQNIDIAVIAVNKADLDAATASQLAVAELGDSDDLQIGEGAIAIGNALGYGQSVTTGVISALNRTIQNSDGTTAENLIQTSAAINPGNSGGALLNSVGQVIGINSSKMGGSTVEGMGFAIPISEVKDLFVEYSERVTRSKVADTEKGYLGIVGTREDYSSMGFPKGAFIMEVEEGSGAEKAGITKFDTITAVDGQTISSFDDLSNILQYYKAGETVEITLQRVENGKLTEMTVDVTLGSRPEQ